MVVAKAGSNCCRQPLQTTEEAKKQTEEVTESHAAAKEISADAAGWHLYTEGFLWWNRCFCFTLDWVW